MEKEKQPKCKLFILTWHDKTLILIDFNILCKYIIIRATTKKMLQSDILKSIIINTSKGNPKKCSCNKTEGNKIKY